MSKNSKEEDIKSKETVYPALPVHDVEAYVKCLQGKVLTLLDAVLADSNQNKAAKDIVKVDFSREMDNMWRQSGYYQGTSYTKSSYEMSPPPSVTRETSQIVQ